MTLGWVVDADGAPLVYGDPAPGTKVARLIGEGHRFVPHDVRDGAPDQAEALALEAAMVEPPPEPEGAETIAGKLAELEARIASVEAETRK